LRLGKTIEWLKTHMSNREFRFWRRYISQHPIDDQSNFHAPQAQLAALFVNSRRKEGTAARRLSDFLLFRPAEEEEDDIDAQLMGGKW
jgi:hypothetical protein